MSKPKPPELKTFFGDAERTFALTPVLIEELERLTGAGIGAIAKRLVRVSVQARRHVAHDPPRPDRRRRKASGRREP